MAGEPAPHYADESVTLHHGDCLDVLATLPDSSVDAVVTDPPYGLEFMGKGWDGADGFRRSLNPADVGRETVFGRTSRTSPEYRTGHSIERFRSNDGYDRLAQPVWRDAPAESAPLYQQWCEAWARECLRVLKPGGHLLAFGGTRTAHRLACAIEDVGFELRDTIAWLYGSGFPKSRNLDGNWQGWGTALKPAHEPIVMARKALVGTVAQTVDAHGTGALNIDGCRTAALDAQHGRLRHGGGTGKGAAWGTGVGGGILDPDVRPASPAGRWPTNVILDPDAATQLDAQAGVTRSRVGAPRSGANGDGWGMTATGAEYDDQGGASRFFPTFRYEAKAPTDERPKVGQVAHPTVKPLDLMRWLVRLVTPPNGVVLEPFAGSGTTAEACIIEGFRCIAIEREADYLPLILARISKPIEPVMFGMEAS